MASNELPDMLPVESSNVKAIGYKEKTKELYVEFIGGSVYKYLDVEKDLHEGLISADSVGKFLNENIKKADIKFERLI